MGRRRLQAGAVGPPAPDRRRLGSFGERRARRRRRFEATRCRVSADPLARCSCVPLPSAPRSRSRADACTARVRACRRAIEKRAGPRVYALLRDGRSTERPSDEAIRRRGRGEGSRRMRRRRRRHGGGGGARRMRGRDEKGALGCEVCAGARVRANMFGHYNIYMPDMGRWT